MKKILSASLLLLFSFSLFAASYDIGGGQSLILNEDGTYEIVKSSIDAGAIIGRQYKLDLNRSIDPINTLMMMEDPSTAILGKDFYRSMIEEMGLLDMIAAEIPDFSLIFLSPEKVLVTMEGEDPTELDYRITGGKELFVSEEEIGTFSDDFSEIQIMSEGIAFYLVQQDL